MNNDKYFWELQRTLSAEFSKYLLSHPEMDAQIPDNAQIVFHLKDQLDFNAWSERINADQREPNQAMIVIGVDTLSPPVESRLVNPHVEATFLKLW